MPLGANDNAPLNPMSIGTDLANEQNQHASMASPHSHRSGRSTSNMSNSGADSFNNTPKGQRGRSQVSLRSLVGKWSGTPATEYLRWTEREPPYGPSRPYEHGGGDEEDLEFELHALVPSSFVPTPTTTHFNKGLCQSQLLLRLFVLARNKALII